jgi:uncharacterized repeat protein (TIGR03803 family)
MAALCTIPRATLLAAATAVSFAATSADGATLQVLYSFTGGADGGSPRGGLIQDRHGNFYGTTYYGGSAKRCVCGTVYRLSPSGGETTLYSFHGRDGYNPVGGLVRNKAGDLFGVTELGGKYFTPDQGGVVFRLNASGEETVLHSFGSEGDGSTLADGLTMDRDGNLYGATKYGNGSYGVIFRIAPDGTETILHTFRGGANDGIYGYSGVMRDKRGNLYGTTMDGGWSGEQQGPGILYKLTSAGNLRVLHHFQDSTDGGYPGAIPLMDANGNLYGDTVAGGQFGKGVVYRFTHDGNYSVLHSFGGAKDGEYGIGRLIMDADGSLYGVTQGGGAACDCGVVYKLAPDGTYTLLHTFTGGSDGGEPYDGLIMDAAGNLYGTASQGGAHNHGAVFKISP